MEGLVVTCRKFRSKVPLWFALYWQVTKCNGWIGISVAEGQLDAQICSSRVRSLVCLLKSQQVSELKKNGWLPLHRWREQPTASSLAVYSSKATRSAILPEYAGLVSYSSSQVWALTGGRRNTHLQVNRLWNSSNLFYSRVTFCLCLIYLLLQPFFCRVHFSPHIPPTPTWG